MSSTCTSREFAFIVTELRAALQPPSSHRVSFKRLPPSHSLLDGEAAYTVKEGRVFTVYVSSGLTKLETIDAVLHEYAHVRSWRPSHPFMHHDAQFGLAYAENYRAFHGVS